MVNAKKTVSIVAGAALVMTMALAGFGGTYAYLVNEENRTNSIFAGENEITVGEEFDDGEIKPGGNVHKLPYVNNTGNLDCFVRMRVDFTSSEFGLPNNGGGWCTLDYNTTEWTYNEEDGYWYYSRILKPGESTKDAPLFTTVSFSTDMQGEYDPGKDGEFDIYVYAESAQAEDFQNGDYMSDAVWERL